MFEVCARASVCVYVCVHVCARACVYLYAARFNVVQFSGFTSVFLKDETFHKSTQNSWYFQVTP